MTSIPWQFSAPGSTACTDSRTGLQVTGQFVLNGTLPGYWTYDEVRCPSTRLSDAQVAANVPLGEICNAASFDSPNLGGIQIWECDTPEFCLGGPNSTCKYGHEGVHCSQCWKYWYLSSGACIPCPTINENAESFTNHMSECPRLDLGSSPRRGDGNTMNNNAVNSHDGCPFLGRSLLTRFGRPDYPAVAFIFFVVGRLFTAMLIVLLLVRFTSEPVDSLDEVEKKLAAIQEEKAK